MDNYHLIWFDFLYFRGYVKFIIKYNNSYITIIINSSINNNGVLSGLKLIVEWRI